MLRPSTAASLLTRAVSRRSCRTFGDYAGSLMPKKQGLYDPEMEKDSCGEITSCVTVSDTAGAAATLFRGESLFVARETGQPREAQPRKARLRSSIDLQASASLST